MLDLSKFLKNETLELFNVLQKATEKSELERFYLFSSDNAERSKIFLLCYRLLHNVYNVMDDGKVRDTVKTELDITMPRALEVNSLLKEMQYNKIFQHRLDLKLFDLLNKDSIVNDLIDVFSVFLERDTILQMSKFKGIVLEGKSKEEYNKIFKEKGKVADIEPDPEDELVEDEKEKEDSEIKDKEVEDEK